jgi:hypothetical protein
LALVGTISGSNGTSTTAISGSLIIADEPLSRFPALPSGVKLFVSGNKTDLGADTPNSIFGGDAFVSGALGTDSYFQMKPVGTLRIPTNATASYIYTSGSTNDLYFTQYSGPYTNTTRLRWLESALQTGLLHGGVLSTENGTTTFSIASGSGLIIDYNATLVEDPYPTIVKVDWPAYVSSSLPNIATTEITYIAIDSTGALVKQSTAYVNGDFEDKIVIGRVLHQSGSVTNGTITSPTVAYGQTGFRGDFIRAFGPLKISGHVVSVNATATNPPTNTQFLGLAKTAGDSYVEGRNYTTNPSSPNYVKSTTDTALTTSKIYREYVNGSGTVVIDSGVGGAGYTAIDVTNYNNAGTLTAIGAGNKFTIQRLYWFPNSVNRAIFAYYGNTIYSTIDDAEAGIASEAFTEGDNTRDAAILIGYLIVKVGATDLGDPAQAKLIQAGLSRAIASTGGGGGSTPPGGADTYVQYNDAGGFNGTNDFRFIEGTGTVLAANLFVTGTTAGSLVTSGTFQVKNGSGAVVGSISTGGVISGSSDLQIGGNITGSNALLGGDIAVNGGDITTTATTFNIVNATATTVNFAGGTSTALNIGNTAGTNTVLGQTKFSQGISGSLTQLTDGTSYLVAGNNVAITTGSNGSVSISSSQVSADAYSFYFGDGADGDVTINTTGISISKEMYYNNLTVTSTGGLKTSGFRVFVKGTLTINSGGTIDDDGIAAGSGGATVAGGGLGTRGYLGGGSGGGGAGRSSTGAGGGAGAAPGNCSPNAAGLAPRGGSGGSAGGANTGGTGGTNAFSPSQQKWITQAFLFSGRQSGGNFGGGSGGGGGGTDITSGAASSGGGGGGAGIVWIAANTISNSGTISAKGGTGANATSAGGIAGGGGGGGGGLVAIITRSSSYGTVSAAGGVGGNGAGVGGGAGANGIDGVVSVRIVP